MSTLTTWPRVGAATGPTTRTGWTPSGARANVGTRFQVTLGVGFAIAYLFAVGGRHDGLIELIILAAAGMAVLFPAAGLAMFVIIMPMRETEIFEPFRANAMIAGAIAFGCFLRFPIDRFPMKVHPGIVLLVGYVVISGLSLLPVVSGHPPAWTGTAANELLKFSTGVALFLSATYLFRLISVRVIVALALVGAALAALLVVGQSLGFTPFDTFTGGLVEVAGGLRASGGFSNPNFLGLYMAPAAVFTLGLLAVERPRLKVLLVPLVILLFACIALTFSRNALLGSFAGVLLLVAFKNRLAALALLIAVLVGAQTVYPAFLEARQGQVLTTEDMLSQIDSEQSRAAVAGAALGIFATYPVFGVGFGVFQNVSSSFTGGVGEATYSHNQWLNILAEQGIVGILLIAGMVVLLAIALWRSPSPWRRAAIAMGVTYLGMSLFINSTTSFQSSCLTWLVMAAALAPWPELTTRVSEV